MARYDTTRRRPAPAPRCGFVKHTLITIAAFLVGYACAVCYDFNSIVAWVNGHLLTSTPSQSAVIAKKSPDIPKPKFEFYTLLTQENRLAAQTASSNASAEASPVEQQGAPVAAATPSLSIDMDDVSQKEKSIETALKATQKPAMRDGYLVQLASFRRAQDAEKMKANLSLKGIIVTVMPVTQQHVQWFRVVLGPFANKLDAQRAQREVMQSARISGMVRKMDA